MLRVQELQICDVCRLLDADTQPKVCYYCKFCDSNICEADSNNWLRRGRAAVRRILEPDYKGDTNYKVSG